ncbi:MAG TPA: type II toxin-antitoxin system VapC family toxin [Gemmatimonadaceae bacterium]|jgi:predicted nucleic acid-binding protein|nr:type II toxin-antitoxin system VapC family toxin [Gemmatimonadaceae bacterium]HPV75989.1 type II toxin-antitoxin system VapC family toxin [Gemmatimonadaceae bacterium]
MIAYLDASVVLRLVLNERDRIKEWTRLTSAVASALTEVECLRTLDRLSRGGALDAKEVASRRESVYRLLEGVEVVELTRSVLRRASESFATPLETLDAIHLSTALLWREARDTELVMATHDKALGTASRSVGLRVIGA